MEVLFEKGGGLTMNERPSAVLLFRVKKYLSYIIFNDYFLDCKHDVFSAILSKKK